MSMIEYMWLCIICIVAILLWILLYNNKVEGFSTADDCRSMRYYGSNPGDELYAEVDLGYSDKYREVKKMLMARTDR